MVDPNHVIMDAQLKNLTNRNLNPEDYFNLNDHERIRKANQHLIKVHVIYQSAEVHMTVLDSRYTLSDKIANFGGNFGIWVELTGFSLLGIINLFLLVLKMFCKITQCFKK